MVAIFEKIDLLMIDFDWTPRNEEIVNELILSQHSVLFRSKTISESGEKTRKHFRS